MMIVAYVPGVAVLGQGHVGNSFSLQKSTETLNLGPPVTEDQDFGSSAIEVRADGIFCPDFSDPAFDVCIFIPTRPTLVFRFHGGGEAMQLG